MANFNVTIPIGQMSDVAWPGTPFPNTGVLFVSATGNSGIITLEVSPGASVNPGGTVKIHAISVGQTSIAMVTRNIPGTQFTDSINVTVTNSTPDATASGMTVSAPHS